jgi:hypothetical protein
MSKPAKTESLLSALEGIMIEQEQQRDLLLRLIRQTAPGHVQLTSEVREALARAAREKMQPADSLVEAIVCEWLRDRGYLPKGAA